MRWMQRNLLLQGEDGHLKAWKKSNYSVNMLSSGFLDNAKKPLRSVTLLIFCYETYVHCNLYINYVTVMFCQNSKKKEIAISKLMLIE